MSLEQLLGRRLRLQRELSVAYSTFPWPLQRIERLAKDLAATERELAALGPVEGPAKRALEPRAGMSQPLPDSESGQAPYPAPSTPPVGRS